MKNLEVYSITNFSVNVAGQMTVHGVLSLFQATLDDSKCMLQNLRANEPSQPLGPLVARLLGWLVDLRAEPSKGSARLGSARLFAIPGSQADYSKQMLTNQTGVEARAGPDQKKL